MQFAGGGRERIMTQGRGTQAYMQAGSETEWTEKSAEAQRNTQGRSHT